MTTFDNIEILQQKAVSVSILDNSPAKLTQQNEGIGKDKKISGKGLYRPQLALAGYAGLFNYKSIQMFGNTEFFYLKGLSEKKRIEAFSTICELPIPCIVLTNKHYLEQKLLDIATKNGVPVYVSEYDTTKATYVLTEYMDDQFAPQAVVHGSFVDVYGVGLLFIGRSGIGKSEIALDLIERGHRLVSDDVVMLTKKRESTLMGTGTSLVQHFMEIRGLGIIDIRQMFGIRSIRFQKRLEIIVELAEYDPITEYTRIGLDEETVNIMDIEISTVKLPIFPGKNITVIAEVIAINYLLRTYGYNASQVFSNNLNQEMKKASGPESAFRDRRITSWLQGDIE
jgi:HPr kinase/phosphorylase